jgi:hypothetical protein
MNTALPFLEGHLLLSIDSSTRSCLKKYLRQLIVGILLTGFVVSFCGAADLQGRIGRGGSGARQRPEARDIAKMKREEKGWRELMEKRRGTNGFIPARGSGWQMGAPPDAHTKRGGR